MDKDKFLIGRKPVMDALNDNSQLEKVWIDNGIKGEFEREIRFRTRQYQIPLQYVPKAKLNSIASNPNHQGIVAQLAVVDYLRIEDVLPHLFETGRIPSILVLDGIEDVRNLGALARTAVWFDFDVLLFSVKKTARLNSFAYKSSAGALKDITVCRENSIINALEFIKQSGLKIIIADMDGPDLISREVGRSPLALVMGSEGRGVSNEIREMADIVMSVPGSGRVESLNVSVAGGILMNEIFKSRRDQGPVNF